MTKELIEDENKLENEFRNSIGMKKAEALIGLKELVSKIGEVRILKEKDDGPDIYISTLADLNRLRKALDQVDTYRSEDEMYLDREAAAMVSYLQDYLRELRTFMTKYPDVPVFVTGIFVDQDIQMWSDEEEKIIIRDMNAANTEIETHSGDEWEAVKRRIYDDMKEKSALHQLQELAEEAEYEADAEWLEWIEDFKRD